MAEQPGWSFCIKCRSLFYDAYEEKGICPAGDEHRAASNTLAYTLPHSIEASGKTQSGWRFCINCRVLFYGAYPEKGRCAAGGEHVAEGLDYVLAHSTPATLTLQNQWRFCGRCRGLFYDAYAEKGVCPAGGVHNRHKSSLDYSVAHSYTEPGIPLVMWVDSLRCHSQTPGFGIGDSDEPFALVAVINLDKRNSLGVPSHDVLLYGPLQNVDDKENHRFSYHPFWQAPLRPGSSIFLTALLEHDNVNPEVSRNAVDTAIGLSLAASAGEDGDRISTRALSAMSAAAEPVSAPAMVNRLIGPPAEIAFSATELAEASGGGEARRVIRFSSYGDYSVHYLARRA